MFINQCLIFFIGILSASNSLKSDNDLLDVKDVQRLLKSLQNDGNVEGSHNHHHKNHHKKHHSKPKHEDDHHLMNIQTLNLIFKHNNLRRDKPIEKNNLMKNDDNRVNKIMCAITGTYGCSKNNDQELETSNDNTSLGDANLVTDAKRERKDFTSNETHFIDPNDKDLEEEAKNDIELLLNDLEKNLLINEERELRCRGNRCGKGQERCRGDRCELQMSDRDDHDDNINELRCKGNRCGKHNADIDYDNDSRYDDRKDDTRCRGNRCGRDRANDDGDEDRSDDDDGKDDLRCRKKRCGRHTARTNDDYDRKYSVKDDLRCIGNRCGRHRDDDNDDDRRENNKKDDLLCIGDRCGGISLNNRGADIDNDFKSVLDNYGKRYKINNELDAIVLDVEHLDGGLLQTLDTSLENPVNAEGKTNLRNSYNNLRHSKFLPSLPLNRWDKREWMRKEIPHFTKLSLTTSKPETLITFPIALGEEVPYRLVERPLTFPQLTEHFKNRVQDTLKFVDVALDYIKDTQMYGSFNKHFTKRGIKISDEDGDYLMGLKNYYHNFVFPKEAYLPYAEKLLKNHIGLNKIGVFPGDVDKVIIPQDMFNEIMAIKNAQNKRLKKKELLRSEKKRLLPLTIKQKMRLSQQQGNGDKVATEVPFVLEVSGLGQVNA